MLKTRAPHTPSFLSDELVFKSASMQSDGYGAYAQMDAYKQPLCSEASLALAHVKFEGNVIPMTWFAHITFESGKADLLAINTLADIVYWYRPIAVRDERTGDFVGYRQKFKHDLLYVKYDDYARRFCCSKDQIVSAIVRLEKHGLIQRHLRTMSIEGIMVNNQVFVELNAAQVRYITQTIKQPNLQSEQASTPDSFSSQAFAKSQMIESTQALPFERPPSQIQKGQGGDSNRGAPPFESDSYNIDTKITTKTDRRTCVQSSNSQSVIQINSTILKTSGQSVGLMNQIEQKADNAKTGQCDQADFHQNSMTCQSMTEIWNSVMGQSLPYLPARNADMQSLLSQVFRDDIESWQAYCQKIAGTPFLRGQGPKGWTATLDWCLKPVNADKILQGCYEPKNKLTDNLDKAASNSILQSSTPLDASLSQETSDKLNEIQQQIEAETNIQMRAFRQHLLKSCGAATYSNWFKNLSFSHVRDGILTLTTSNKLMQDYCNGRFAPQLYTAAQACFAAQRYQVQLMQQSQTNADLLKLSEKTNQVSYHGGDTAQMWPINLCQRPRASQHSPQFYSNPDAKDSTLAPELTEYAQLVPESNTHASLGQVSAFEALQDAPQADASLVQHSNFTININQKDEQMSYPQSTLKESQQS